MTSAAEALARTVAAGLVELAREAGREAAREEIAARGGAPEASKWKTPPAAAKLTGIPVRTIHKLRKAGLIRCRLRNADEGSKAPKYQVNIDELEGTVERLATGGRRPAPASAAPAIDLQERAARIRAGR